MELGFSRSEFWSLTPRKIGRLWQRFLDREERADRRFGWLFTAWANANRNEDRHPVPYQVDDFMPGRKYHKHHETAEETVARMRAYVATLPDYLLMKRKPNGHG